LLYNQDYSKREKGEKVLAESLPCLLRRTDPNLLLRERGRGVTALLGREIPAEGLGQSQLPARGPGTQPWLMVTLCPVPDLVSSASLARKQSTCEW